MTNEIFYKPEQLEAWQRAILSDLAQAEDEPLGNGINLLGALGIVGSSAYIHFTPMEEAIAQLEGSTTKVNTRFVAGNASAKHRPWLDLRAADIRGYGIEIRDEPDLNTRVKGMSLIWFERWHYPNSSRVRLQRYIAEVISI